MQKEDVNPTRNEQIIITTDKILEPRVPETFRWKDRDGSSFITHINDALEKIVYWRRNLFLLPTGNAGKEFIKEMTRPIDSWTNDTTLKPIALKALHIIPALILQKPSKSSKAKDPLESTWTKNGLMGRRRHQWVIRWRDRYSKQVSKPSNTTMNIGKLSSKFKQLMQKGK